jgi:apolipoprotein N-acyltransferase
MTALVGAVVSGVLYGLSFPPFNFSTLAWIAFLPLLLSTGPTRRELFRPAKSPLYFDPFSLSKRP